MAQGRTKVSLAAGSTGNFHFANSNPINFTDNIMTVYSAGTSSKLYIRVTSNDRAATTYRLRKNAGNGNQSITITGSTTGEFVDDTNTDVIATNDKVNFQIVVGAGGTSFIYSIANNLFRSNADTVARIGIQDNDPISTDSTNFYYAMGGRCGTGTTASPTVEQISAKVPATFQKMGIRVTTNTRSTVTNAGFNKNGSAGNLLMACTASTTGTFEDTTHTDTVVVDDSMCFYMTTSTGGGSFRFGQGMWVEMVTTNGQWQTFAGQSGSDAEATFLAGSTYYICLGGQISQAFSTESEIQIKPRVDFVGSNAQVRVAANTAVANSILRLRKNATNGNQVVTITGLTTGLFQDTTNSDAIAATDEVNYSLAVGAAGTNIVITAVNMLCSTVASSGDYFRMSMGF